MSEAECDVRNIWDPIDPLGVSAAGWRRRQPAAGPPQGNVIPLKKEEIEGFGEVHFQLFDLKLKICIPWKDRIGFLLSDIGGSEVFDSEDFCEVLYQLLV